MLKDSRLVAMLSDGYKYSHAPIYPPNTTLVHSYMESRGGPMDEIVCYGYYQFIKRYLTGRVVTIERIQRMKKLVNSAFGFEMFNEKGWMSLYRKHKGLLPIKIWAKPEGSLVGQREPIMAVENTDPEFFWLTNFLETLLVNSWYPITVASNSLRSRKLQKKYLTGTSVNSEAPMLLNTRLHDFGQRGVTCPEQAAIGGSAHLLSYMGTDTFAALAFIQDWYDDDLDKVFGITIPASEHSTITAWGEAFELKAFENMLDRFPKGIIACVSDSFDIERAIREYWGKKLKQKVLSRDGTLVIRPDSGDPVMSTQKVAQAIWETFGGHTNSKGFKVFDPHVRMIQGDGIDFESLGDILANFKALGFSTENIAFGSGGGLLQNWNRDTLKFAFKCSYGEVNGESVDVRKNPKAWNADGEYVQSNKFSKSGRFDSMPLLFEDGEIKGKHYFQDIVDKVRAHN